MPLSLFLGKRRNTKQIELFCSYSFDHANNFAIVESKLATVNKIINIAAAIETEWKWGHLSIISESEY